MIGMMIGTVVLLLAAMVVLATFKTWDEHAEEFHRHGGTFGGHSRVDQRKYRTEQAITILAGITFVVLLAVVTALLWRWVGG